MPITDKVIGKYAAKTIYGRNQRIPLVREGTMIRPSMLETMRRQGITWVWVLDSLFPDLYVREAVKNETLEVARKSLEDTFQLVQMDQRPSEKRAADLVASVQAMVEDIISNRDVVANVSHLRVWDNYTFEHSVHVAILTAIIAKHLKMTPDQMTRIGVGAILHDIGKLMVPQEILQKPATLTPEEMDVIRQHPVLGWDLVHEGFSSIMPTSSIVVRQHHERLDGSGYPDGRKGDDIYLFSRIVAAADVFDALRAERAYRPVYTPRRILQTIREETGPKLDPRAVEALLTHVAIIPEGEIVRLTNGLLGMVVTTNPGYALQPVVQVVADDRDQPVEREMLDLKETPVEVDCVLDDWPELVEERVAARMSRHSDAGSTEATAIGD